MITKSLPWVERRDHPAVGRLFTPRHCNREVDTAQMGMAWACDNDGYSGFDEGRFMAMLTKVNGLPGCRFVAAPDVVADADATLLIYPRWAEIIREHGHPPALVAQDGLTVETTPWDDLDALFIGGTTEFKLGPVAEGISHEAKARGKYLHMGRVNSMKRIRIAARFGCDSVDGSGAARFPDSTLTPMLRVVDELYPREKALP